ncbi:hypothetical protein ACIPY1_18895 [Paenarthrobacter nicotinovorans]|uniref:hypothetical protein n=1 Tax=Paenarthrobacter nicotinovorans TaxID=29320 RepID=UPI00382C39F2
MDPVDAVVHHRGSPPDTLLSSSLLTVGERLFAWTFQELDRVSPTAPAAILQRLE